jgi:hypothetical protein
LLAPFQETLQAGWPAAEAKAPEFPPAVGGLILAARAAGQATDAQWFDQVRATLERSGD